MFLYKQEKVEESHKRCAGYGREQHSREVEPERTRPGSIYEHIAQEEYRSGVKGCEKHSARSEVTHRRTGAVDQILFASYCPQDREAQQSHRQKRSARKPQYTGGGEVHCEASHECDKHSHIDPAARRKAKNHQRQQV